MTVRWIVLRAPFGGGRLTVRCARCGRYMWPTPQELFRWTACAHCVGWWTFHDP